MKRQSVICILDPDQERCLRAEQALDAAIEAKQLAVSGISNFGACYLARSGVETFPAIDLDGMVFFPRNAGEELSFELLCDFLDMLVRKGLIHKKSSENGKEAGERSTEAAPASTRE